MYLHITSPLPRIRNYIAFLLKTVKAKLKFQKNIDPSWYLVFKFFQIETKHIKNSSQIIHGATCEKETFVLKAPTLEKRWVCFCLHFIYIMTRVQFVLLVHIRIHVFIYLPRLTTGNSKYIRNSRGMLPSTKRWLKVIGNATFIPLRILLHDTRHKKRRQD